MNVSLAITIPDEIKHTLSAASARHADAAVSARWVERDHLQFPIVNIGAVAPSFVPHITEAITGICRSAASFPVHVYGFGFYGSKRFPHSVWAAVEPEDAMFDLYEKLWGAVSQFGFTKPKEEFRPHIILATFPGSAKNRPLLDALDADEDIEFGVWHATRLAIYDCRVGRNGRSYRKLDQLPLG